jgi:hypothetical protein
MSGTIARVRMRRRTGWIVGGLVAIAVAASALWVGFLGLKALEAEGCPSYDWQVAAFKDIDVIMGDRQAVDSQDCDDGATVAAAWQGRSESDTALAVISESAEDLGWVRVKAGCWSKTLEGSSSYMRADSEAVDEQWVLITAREPC